MSQLAGNNQYLSDCAKISVQHHEWRTAANSAGHLLPILKARVAVTPFLALLDAGAGSGTITADLAQLMPSGRVVAFDISTDILSSASEHCASLGLTNVTTQQGSVYELPFENDTFDVVHASMILGHLNQPASALAEMRRATKKPGGVVALHESDLRAWTFYPEIKGLRESSAMICAAHAASGASVDAGPKLVKWALEVGILREQIQAGASSWCYSSREEREMWGGMMANGCKVGARREKALDLGITSEEELEQMARGWEEWVKAEDGWFGCINGQVIITF